jgi:hypothetical protein
VLFLTIEFSFRRDGVEAIGFIHFRNNLCKQPLAKPAVTITLHVFTLFGGSRARNDGGVVGRGGIEGTIKEKELLVKANALQFTDYHHA